MTEKNKPIKKWRKDRIEIAEWDNGKDIPKSYSIARMYKQDDEWKRTTSFSIAQLKILGVLLDCAVNDKPVPEDTEKPGEND